MRFDRLMEQLAGVIALLVLAGGTVIVITPFLTALLWGAILAYCTWHPFQRLAAALGGKRAWAALLVVLGGLLILLGPVFYASVAFSARLPELVAAAQARLSGGLPPLPDWLLAVPALGARIGEAWEGLAARNQEVVAQLRDLAGSMFRTAIDVGLSIIQGLGLLMLSMLFAGYFYLRGDHAAARLRGGMIRIAGERADYLLGLIGGTIKGVVFGILGTSLIQALLCAAGFALAGLPSPAALGLATFFLAIIPGGPLLIVIPGALWLMQQGQEGWAAFLVGWSAVVAIGVDNVLKPMLIGRTSHISFILVMLGVIGGAAAFGLLGVFIGPTLLAVATTVLEDWTATNAARRDSEPTAAPPTMMPAGMALHENVDQPERTSRWSRSL